MSTDAKVKFQSLTPCTDWFYIGEDTSTGKLVIFRVAAWALRPDGDVVGMIAAYSARTAENEARLVTAPSIGGSYYHRDSLTEDQIKQAADGARPDHWPRRA